MNQASDRKHKERPAERFVQVAVPAPLPEPLTYRLGTTGQLAPGVRVRVPLGRRVVVGLVLDTDCEPPEGIEDAQIKSVQRVLDRLPVLPTSLLELGRFTSQYYLAPIGEVFRFLLPPALDSWGEHRFRITDRGLFEARAQNEDGEVLRFLLQSGVTRRYAIEEHFAGFEVGPVLERLQSSGYVRLEASSQNRHRYETAYEVRTGARELAGETLSRSPKAMAAFEWLRMVERPATATEICAAVGCSAAVLQRLHRLDLVRKFSEIRTRAIDRHLLERGHEQPFELRSDQEAAVEHLTAAVDARSFQVHLLHGVTGSGKTEVYLRGIERALGQERTAVVMVPEIAMVPSLARTLTERFGSDRVAVLHSNLSRTERTEQWQRARSGAARIVVGPRSAVFAPVQNLGLIVVDEEHDSAYKQDATPRYHGRDLAIVRAREEGAVALLASATPSLESRLNADRGRYHKLELTERVGAAGMPEGEIVDLRYEPFSHRPGEVHFSDRLREAIRESIDRGGQVILLRNRRGFAPLLLCRACGEDLRCEDCGLPRTWHRRDRCMLCHYCGSRIAVPKRCVSCSEEALEAIGAGTERVEEQFRELFPEVEVATLDRDVSRRRGGAAAVLEGFRSGRVRVMVGTQMVAKGHHFPDVDLVAVLSADSYLGFPDFRAVERTYNLLTQVAGRAGRGERAGQFLIQTHHPDHYAIQAALEHDDESFARAEMRFREMFHYPPFTRMVSILVQDTNRSRGNDRIEEIARAIEHHRSAGSIRVVGPAPAALEKLRGKWRYQLLVRGATNKRLRSMLEDLELIDSRDVILDVDPHDLL